MNDCGLCKLTLIDRLREHAGAAPDKLCYVFLAGNECTQSITFRDLERRVDAVAACLADRFAPGERVMLLMPTGIDFVVGFMASLTAGLIAVPGYPPRKGRSDQRLRAIMRDSAPVAIIGNVESEVLVETPQNGSPGVAVMSLNYLETDGSSISRVSESRRGRVAFLQYTSGSTGRPKGVVVTHANLTFNARQMQVSFAHTPRSLGVNWLPLFHDMGLVGCVLQSLYVGFTSVILSPVSFVLEPARWLQAVAEFRATTIGGPNFAYDLCAKNITPEQKNKLDLSSLRVAFNGSEPVRPQTLERFAAAFRCCGFKQEAIFPCYGLAESTLFVSGGPAGSGPRVMWTSGSALERHQIRRCRPHSPGSRRLVSCGQIAAETDVAIVDPQTQSRCPPDMVGEIWIASRAVADGYWNNQLETEATFAGFIADDLSKRQYLRTGDTGIVHDGELYVAGRLKDVIIVRGRKIYPQDVEALVESELRRVYANYVAAFGVNTEEGEALGVVVEADRSLTRAIQKRAEGRDAVDFGSRYDETVTRLISAIRESVSKALDVSVYSICFMKAGTFPRTSSGKVRRRTCQEAVNAGLPDVIFKWHRGARSR